MNTLVLFLILGGMFSVFHHWQWCLLPLLCWGRFLLCAFFKSFNHKWVLNFVKGFFCIYWDYIFLSFNLLIWCIILIDFRILKNPCIPGINPTWSWCMSFLMCSWNLFAKICWGFLHLCSSVILACSFLFLCCLCLVLVSGWWWTQRMSLEVFLPLKFFESFRKIGISSPLNVW